MVSMERDAFGRAALAYGPTARSVAAVLDEVVAAGVAVPPRVVEAVETLMAYGVALSSNALGVPTPDFAREALGLSTPTRWEGLTMACGEGLPAGCPVRTHHLCAGCRCGCHQPVALPDD